MRRLQISRVLIAGCFSALAGCGGSGPADLAGAAATAAMRSRCVIDDQCVDRSTLETMTRRDQGGR